jgi:hypothetical protein
MVRTLISLTGALSCPISKMTSRWKRTNGTGSNGRRIKKRASNLADSTELPAAVNRAVKATAVPNREAVRALGNRAKTYNPMIPTAIRAARYEDGALALLVTALVWERPATRVAGPTYVFSHEGRCKEPNGKSS